MASVLRATHTTRSSSPRERGGSRGSETRHLISASFRSQKIEPPHWFHKRTHPLALFPTVPPLRHGPRPDRDHARVHQEFALRYTAPLAPSIHGTWHKPPPRFSQGAPSALCSKLLIDHCEPRTTTPCVPPLIAPHHTCRRSYRVILRQAALQIHAARNAQECTFSPKVRVCLRSSRRRDVPHEGSHEGSHRQSHELPHPTIISKDRIQGSRH